MAVLVERSKCDWRIIAAAVELGGDELSDFFSRSNEVGKVRDISRVCGNLLESLREAGVFSGPWAVDDYLDSGEA